MALHTALTIDAYALLVLADQRRIRDYGQLPQLAKDEIGRVRGETLKDREDHEIVRRLPFTADTHRSDVGQRKNRRHARQRTRIGIHPDLEDRTYDRVRRDHRFDIARVNILQRPPIIWHAAA